MPWLDHQKGMGGQLSPGVAYQPLSGGKSQKDACNWLGLLIVGVASKWTGGFIRPGLRASAWESFDPPPPLLMGGGGGGPGDRTHALQRSVPEDRRTALTDAANRDLPPREIRGGGFHALVRHSPCQTFSRTHQ